MRMRHLSMCYDRPQRWWHGVCQCIISRRDDKIPAYVGHSIGLIAFWAQGAGTHVVRRECSTKCRIE
jgi:hypothetical protein